MKYTIALLIFISISAITFHLSVTNKIDSKLTTIFFCFAIASSLCAANVDIIKRFKWGNIEVVTAKEEMRAEKISLLKEIDDQVTIHKTAISELIKKAEEHRKLTELWVEGQFAVNVRDYEAAIKIFKKIYDCSESKLAWEVYAESLYVKAEHNKGKSNYKELLAIAKKEYMKMEGHLKDGECAWFLARISALQDDEPECKKWLEYGSEHKMLPSKKVGHRDNEFLDIKKYDTKDWMQSIVWGDAERTSD